MWDGRVDTVEAAIENALNSTEMSVDWNATLEHVRTDREVSVLISDHNQQIDQNMVISTLVSYVEKISRTETRFDYFMKGDQLALSDKEKFGLRIFTHKAHCSSCHLVDGDSSPFTDGGFHDNGLTKPSDDVGRISITHEMNDIGAFKTPSLRGVALRPYLMHDGSYTDLRSVIDAYNRAGGAHSDPRIRPLFLTEDETQSLLSFLSSLSPISN